MKLNMVAKVDLLLAVEQLGAPYAQEVAELLGLPYRVTAVALLRGQRDGLLKRWRDAKGEPFRYELTPRGTDRLEYLEAQEGADSEGLDHEADEMEGDPEETDEDADELEEEEEDEDELDQDDDP